MPNITFQRVAPGILVEKGLRCSPYYAEHYGKLLGARVIEIRFEAFEGGQVMPVLVFNNGKAAIVYCDPEGNGPGHLDIQDS